MKLTLSDIDKLDAMEGINYLQKELKGERLENTSQMLKCYFVSNKHRVTNANFYKCECSLFNVPFVGHTEELKDFLKSFYRYVREGIYYTTEGEIDGFILNNKHT